MGKKIAIVGAGEIGSALRTILSEKEDLEILMWDKDEGKVEGMRSLEEVVRGAAFVFLCVPSTAERVAIESFKGYLSDGAVVISLTKGIARDSLETVDEVLMEMLPRLQPFAVLAGPILAEEIEAGLIGAGLLASKHVDVLKNCKKLFKDTKLKLDTSTDITGASLAGVLKNVYAIALGIVEGLELGNNARGWLITESLKEMTQILQILGGKQETVFGLAGVGDLIATGLSEHSSNHQLGFELGKNGKSSKKSEGQFSLPALVTMLDVRINELKVFKAVADVVLEGKNVKEVFEELLK